MKHPFVCGPGFALVALAASLRCGTVATFVVLGVTVVLVVGFQTGFVVVCCSAFPYNAWAWSLVASSGIPWFLPWQRRLAERHGRIALDQARDGVLGGLDDDQASGDEARDATDLGGWLQHALGACLGDARCDAVAAQLNAAGLTHDRMVEAARLPGGFAVLVEMISAQTEGSGLRPGDHLAVATAAMRQAERRGEAW